MGRSTHATGGQGKRTSACDVEECKSFAILVRMH